LGIILVAEDNFNRTFGVCHELTIAAIELGTKTKTTTPFGVVVLLSASARLANTY
jgi:hypothetical protein